VHISSNLSAASSGLADGRKPKALVLISSAREVPLAQPAGHAVSTGFFLGEVARVQQDFGDAYEFVFSTPDGKAPQLDINGLALWFNAGPEMGAALQLTAELAESRDVARLRERLAGPNARREQQRT
jgi:hypothetical protein